MQAIKLFCFPYAGGSAGIYLKFKKYLNPSIALCPVELAGRGKRYSEPLYNDIYEMTADIYDQIRDEIQSAPYALFGHSMGSLTAFELAHRIKREGGPTPTHIFFSGKKAPHIPRGGDKTYLLPEETFKAKLLDLGGTPKELLESKELLDIFLPLLRADFKVVETYEYMGNQEKLDCNFTVINGKKDEMTITEIVGWRQHTTKDCAIFMLDGGHFFINEKMEDVAKIINHTLTGS